jgi:hypothetical protein
LPEGKIRMANSNGVFVRKDVATLTPDEVASLPRRIPGIARKVEE